MEGMTMNEVEKTARAVLQKGVDFNIDVANPGFLHKIGVLPATRMFVIRPSSLGPLFDIAELLCSMEQIDVEDVKQDLHEAGLRNIIANKDIIVQVMALSILNREISGPWLKFRKWCLVRFLDKNLSCAELVQLMVLVTAQIGVTDFLSATVLMKKLNIIETVIEKKDPSISGKSSEELPSISELQ